MATRSKSKRQTDPPKATARASEHTAVIIGGVFTILAAVVTSVGTYLATRPPSDAPIISTQSSLYENVTPSPTQPVLGLSTWFQRCPGAYQLPSSFAGLGNRPDDLRKIYDEHLYENWPALIPLSDTRQMRFWVTAGAGNREWLKLSNSITVTVMVLGPNIDLDQEFIVGGCGAGGNIREFPAIDLQQSSDTYSYELLNKEFDFFTLEPGEPELFAVPLVCRTPGKYTLVASSQYEYLGQTLIAQSPQYSVVCARSARLH